MPSPARFSLATPHPGSSGAAISIIQVEADSPPQLDALLTAIGVGTVPPNRVALRSIAGIDTGLVARWTPTIAHLMPHGGAIIVHQICERLLTLGATESGATGSGATGGLSASADRAALSAHAHYPESADLIEACALDAIAHASSPLAIDAILRQRDLWRQAAPPLSPADARALAHLLTPPTIVLLGPPNIGKSTLTNALARRQVSIVADQPGTTRDHVGVMLDLAGLVVRWIDAPGINPLPGSRDPIERAAIELALSAAKHADLILLCADATREPTPFSASAAPTLRVALRADLGQPHGMTPDITTSAHTGQGIAELAHAVREALVPSRLLTTESRWHFHPALP